MKYFISDKNEHLVDELIESFQRAEKRLKEIERSSFGEGVDIPAINELRYAASHIIATLKSSSSEEFKGDDRSFEKQEEDIRRAIRHTQRASYDAIEAGVLSKLYLIKSVQEDYRDIVISSIITGWPDILGTAGEINAKIQAINISDEKEDNYELVYQQYLELDKITNKFSGYRDELNKHAVLLREKASRDYRSKVITYAISGSALVIALIQLMIKLLSSN